MAIVHSKVSAVADGANTSLVRPSDWNDDHDITTSVVTPATDDKILIKDTSGSDGLAHILVSALLALVVDSAPGALDTLNELAAALGDDANFATTVTNALALKAPLAPRDGTTASSATPTPDADAHDLYTITALAVAAELQNPSGTPVNGQVLIVRIKDDGTARALTFDTDYRAIGVTLPTTTVISKTMYIGTIYNSADSKWDVLSVVEEA
jgi:hypothetical protein